MHDKIIKVKKRGRLNELSWLFQSQAGDVIENDCLPSALRSGYQLNYSITIAALRDGPNQKILPGSKLQMTAKFI